MFQRCGICKCVCANDIKSTAARSADCLASPCPCLCWYRRPTMTDIPSGLVEVTVSVALAIVGCIPRFSLHDDEPSATVNRWKGERPFMAKYRVHHPSKLQHHQRLADSKRYRFPNFDKILHGSVHLTFRP